MSFNHLEFVIWNIKKKQATNNINRVRMMNLQVEIIRKMFYMQRTLTNVLTTAKVVVLGLGSGLNWRLR